MTQLPIRIAVNYSDHLMKLMEQRPNLVVKVSDWDSTPKVEEVLRRFPKAEFLVHSTLAMASGTTVDHSGRIWNELKALVPMTRTPYLSAHIAYNCEVDYSPEGKWIFGRRLTEDEQIENMRRNVGILRDAFGLEVALENQTNCYGGAFVPHFVQGCTAPEFMIRALEATGCPMLLDLAHVRVNAAFLGMSVEEYLAPLPIETVREIHLSGCRVVKDNLLSDEHVEMEEVDYDLLRRTLSCCHPYAVTLEYDKSCEHLEPQIQRLEHLAK